MNTQELAYQLWEKAGRPEGLDEHFWYEAEKQQSFLETMTKQQQQNNKLLNNILDGITYARDKEYYGKHPVKIETEIVHAQTRFLDPENLKSQPWYKRILNWW